MIQFAISFLLVFLTSYFITSTIKPKKNTIGIIYLLLIAFTQIVGIFEFLSLFSAINQITVLCLNILLFIGSIILWKKSGKTIWNLKFDSDIKNRIANSLKLDNGLNIIYIAFCFSIIVAIILCFVFQISNMDAWSYHAARCLFWIKNGNLNHFTIADIRNLCLPINSEILYTWVLLFTHKDVFLGFFSFSGYIISILSIFMIMGNMGFCIRKRLWTIFILSAFASVIVQISGTETDIIIAGLVTSSIALFWHGLKNYNSNDKKESFIPIFMSSLAYALAIGTKTTAFFTIPTCAIIFLLISKKHLNEKYYKPFLYFLGFGAINFLFFASYNYILNLIDFHSLSGPDSFVIVSRNYYGIKGMIYNSIRSFTQLIDTTGFKWATYLNPFLVKAGNHVIDFLHVNNVKDGLYSITGTYMNATMLEPLMGPGILGTFVFLPCLFWALLRPIKEKIITDRKIKKKTIYLFIAALTFIINMLIMNYMLCFMTFSIRFITFLLIISSPILAYSYYKKSRFIKGIIILFAVFYFTITSTNIWARPFYTMLVLFNKYNFSISQLREHYSCGTQGISGAAGTCALRQYIDKNIPKEDRIIVFPNTASGLFLLYRKNLDGFHIDTGLFEDISNIDTDNYKYIIFHQKQNSSFIKYTKENECNLLNNKMVCKAIKPDTLPCYYKNNKNLPASFQDGHPYNVICGMTKSYIDKKNLKFIQIIEPKHNLGQTIDEEQIFYVYQNPNYKK